MDPAIPSSYANVPSVTSSPDTMHVTNDSDVTSQDLYFRATADVTAPLGFTIFYYSLVIPIAYIGNLFTYIIVCKLAKYRTSVPDTLIGGLALNDVLTAVIVFTPSIVSSVRGEYFRSRVFCEFSAVTVVWYIYTTFAIIVLINIERYVAITRPFLHKRLHLTPLKIKAGIGLQGFFCLLLASIPLIKYPVRLQAGWYCAVVDAERGTAVKEIVFITIVFLVTGITILVGCNICIAYELSHSRVSQPLGADTSFRKKFAKLMGVVAVLFLLTWIPNLCAHVACLYGVERCEELEFWAMRIVNIGVAVNPIVYGVMNRTYRKGYCYLICITAHYITCKLIPRPTHGEEIFDQRLPKISSIISSSIPNPGSVTKNTEPQKNRVPGSTFV